MGRDSYGDIVYGGMKTGLIESLKATAAKTLADEISCNRGEHKDHQDEAEAIEYIESLGYRYDCVARAWRYRG